MDRREGLFPKQNKMLCKKADHNFTVQNFLGLQLVAFFGRKIHFASVPKKLKKKKRINRIKVRSYLFFGK